MPRLKKATEGLNIIVVQTEAKLKEMIATLETSEFLAFDTETNSLDVFKEEGKTSEEADWYSTTSWGTWNEEEEPIEFQDEFEFAEDFKLVGLSFAIDATTSYYIPIGHTQPRQIDWMAEPVVQLSRYRVLTAVKHLLENKKIICHNMKYDYKVMLRYGIVLNSFFCTMLACAVLDHRLWRGLKFLTKRILGREPLSLKEMADDYDLSYVDISKAATYAGPDASNCFELYIHFRNRLFLPENRQLKGIFDLEMKTLLTIIDMEMTGLGMDSAKVDNIARVLDSKMEVAENAARKALIGAYKSDELACDGTPFAPTKGQHISYILYNIFRLPFKAGQGRNSLEGKSPGANDRKTMEDFCNDRQLMKGKPQAKDFIKAMMEWRTLKKLRSTYTYNLLAMVSTADNKLHPEFKQYGTETGRIAGRNPNTMNLPRRKDDYDIRSLFITDRGECFVSADYIAMEMRITAALSGDPTLTKIVLGKMKVGELGNFEGVVSARKDDEGEFIVLTNETPVDIHCYTVMSILNISYDKVTDEQRTTFKPVGFGILYGRTQHGLAPVLGVNPNTAQKYIDGWFDTFKQVRQFMDKCRDFIFDNKYMSTYFGRRRLVPKWEEGAAWSDLEQSGTFRQLVNTRIQGTAADITKMAMVKVRSRLIKEGIDAKLVLQIHDEIVLKCKIKDMKRVAKILTDCMRYDLVGLGGVIVPIVGDVKATGSLSKSAKDLLRAA